MARKIFIIIVGVFSLFPLHSDMVGQITEEDSIKCAEHFKWFKTERNHTLTIWSRAPLLKESNAPILDKLHEISLPLIDSPNSYALLVIEENGRPICVEISFEIENDSLRMEILDLLYMIEFEPAIGGDNKPVWSRHLLWLSRDSDWYFPRKKRKSKK